MNDNTFAGLGLPQTLLSALTAAGFETPTPIQAQAIPHQMQGRDILGIAQTGSGKTAAFGLPILSQILAMTGRANPLTARALILVPTRELAVQIDEVLRQFGGSRISTVLILGGMSRHAQVTKMARGVDVAIATPGRLKDLIDDRKIRLNETKWLVLDEADRMLDMGFIKPVTEIARTIGRNRQTALFSATMPLAVAQLAAGLLNDPVRVEATPQGTTVADIEQSVLFVPMAAKRAQMRSLLRDKAMSKVIVFARTKHGADRVTKNLALDGFEAAAIHGNKSQNARQAALKGFTSGQVRLLVATDIAARGIDVPDITHVINYELPEEAETYVHRIGRTGRNGAKGIAISLVDGAERGKLKDIEKLIRRSLPVGEGGLTATEMAAEKAAAPARSGERPPQHNQARPGQNRGGQGKPQRRSGQAPQRSSAPALAGEGGDGQLKAWLDNKPQNARAKPRWDKAQREAGKARRSSAAQVA